MAAVQADPGNSQHDSKLSSPASLPSRLQKLKELPLVTVFGGTGFLGHRIVRHLIERGYRVRVASRHPERAAPRQNRTIYLEPFRADITKPGEVRQALDGSVGMVNAVSLYRESGSATFQAIHVDAAGDVARLANDGELSSFVHVSGIGADPDSRSAYIRARGEGENAVRQHFPAGTIVRPSVMFGPDDNFLNRLCRLVRILPVFPLFGTGETKLQPVYVEDVAAAVAAIVDGAGPPDVRLYEFGGAEVHTYRNLVETVADMQNAKTRPVPVPLALWHALAVAGRLWPGGGPVDSAQVEMMAMDNVASPELPGLAQLGIKPVSIAEIAAVDRPPAGKKIV